VTAVPARPRTVTGTGTAGRERFRRGLSETAGVEVDSCRGHHGAGALGSRQGRRLDRILDSLDEMGIHMSEVMVIGPFRDVAREVRHAGGGQDGVA
jgi:hypothetical protein